MKKASLLTAFCVVGLASFGGTASAQYYYPPGYANWGWGGWGGGGGATVQGDVARGLGTFAAGAGVYNLKTAEARSINADTAMRWNQYVWQSQQEANKRYYTRQVKSKQNLNRGREEIYKRLRDNPSTGDINRGDALNVALDEVTNPQVYLRNMKGASAKITGPTIRDIPFQYASAAITASVEQLTKGGPPAALKTPAFAANREALKEIAAQVRKEDEEQGRPDPATLKKARGILEETRSKVAATLPKNSKQREDAEKYLKALYGLTHLLEGPAIDVLLAGVENRPEATLGALLGFMESYNLRFGVANTPKQVAAYAQLYPLLDTLRDEAAASLAGKEPASASTLDDSQPSEFFSGMDLDQLGSTTGSAGVSPEKE